MRWKGRRQSSNVEDRRGQRSSSLRGGMPSGLASILLPLFMRGGFKTKMLMAFGALIAMFVFKVNPLSLLGFSSGTGNQTNQAAVSQVDQNDETSQYIRTILADTETVWSNVFSEQLQMPYQQPKLILFTERTPMPGGQANAATGPFYLTSNQSVYLDTSFFDQLKHQFQAAGDFAEAYVIYHEVGHHVQRLLRLTDWLHQKHGKVSKIEYNQSSVRLELHADFLSGVCAYHANKAWQHLEEGDIEEAIRCAAAIGDDALQKQSQGYVVPDSFTHGTSAQRQRWFMTGFRSGRLDKGEQIFTMPYSSL